MKVGLLGGSFDPVHNGHLKLAAAARRQLGLKKVFFVLTPRSPSKLKSAVTPVSTRLRWLRASLKGRPYQIGPWELKNRGPTYSIKTVRKYHQAHPKDRIFFIMGSDAWKTFDRWKN